MGKKDEFDLEIILSLRMFENRRTGNSQGNWELWD